MSTQTELISIELGSRHETIHGTTQLIAQPRSQPSVPELDNLDSTEPNYQQLLPVDGGIAAWRLLCTAFVFEALLWGFPASFGVFQNYYSQLPQFAHSPYLSVVGTVASGLGYLGAPIATSVMKRYPRYQRQMIWFGWPICITGLIAGSFATNLGGLIVTQGVIYGIGFLIFYYPILNFVNEFWVERRGMAYGLLCSASGVSGIGMPFIITALLKKYGYPTTLRATAIALTILTGPLIPTLKGRLPVSSSSTTVAATDWTFLRLPLFWIYSLSNLIYGLGFFFPGLHLPSYATSISLSPTTGALLLALLSISQVAGQFSFGYLSDKRKLINTLLITSTFISAIACLTLWRLAYSPAPLIAFSLLYGFFGAGYTALWGRMVTSVSKEPMAHMAMFSFFNVGKGIGNVSAGPLSAALMGYFVSGDGRKEVERFGPVILFTGACMFCSGAVIGAWTFWERFRRGCGRGGN